ncbi:YtxH domain-containing protein [Carnobacterium sp.]|uniref:YtxH domain-containing protein n=1 Tax=Carnobacterium sp. TaxID=48221 RepID=UPI003C73EC4F
MSKNNFMGTLFVGAAAAITALLFAPKSGRELRNDLKEEALSMKNQAMDKVNELADEVKVAYQEVEEEIYYDNENLADTIASMEDDLNATANLSEESTIELDPMNLFDETDAINQEYPPLEDLDSHNDIKIEDRRGQI